MTAFEIALASVTVHADNNRFPFPTVSADQAGMDQLKLDLIKMTLDIAE